MQHRNAPAVQYPVGRSRLEGWVLLLPAVAGTLAAVAWGWPWSAWRPDTLLTWDGRAAWMLAALWAALVPAAWAWWRTPSSLLAWDGAAWSWSGIRQDSTVHGVQLVADAQWALLLRPFDARGRTLGWLWAERVALPLQWKPLRRALVAAGTPVPATSLARRADATGEPA